MLRVVRSAVLVAHVDLVREELVWVPLLLLCWPVLRIVVVSGRAFRSSHWRRSIIVVGSLGSPVGI